MEFSRKRLYRAHLEITALPSRRAKALREHLLSSLPYRATFVLDELLYWGLAVWLGVWLVNQGGWLLAVGLVWFFLLTAAFGVRISDQDLPSSGRPDLDPSRFLIPVGPTGACYIALAAFIIRCRMREPRLEEVNFDEITVLAPVIKHLTQPTLDALRQKMQHMRSLLAEATGIQKRIARLIEGMSRERDATENPHWQQTFVDRLVRLEKLDCHWKDRIVALWTAAAALEKQWDAIYYEVRRIQRFGALVKESDSLLGTSKLYPPLDSTALESRTDDIMNALEQADNAASSYMAARAELDSVFDKDLPP